MFARAVPGGAQRGADEGLAPAQGDNPPLPAAVTEPQPQVPDGSSHAFHGCGRGEGLLVGRVEGAPVRARAHVLAPVPSRGHGLPLPGPRRRRARARRHRAVVQSNDCGRSVDLRAQAGAQEGPGAADDGAEGAPPGAPGAEREGGPCGAKYGVQPRAAVGARRVARAARPRADVRGRVGPVAIALGADGVAPGDLLGLAGGVPVARPVVLAVGGDEVDEIEDDYED
mmetsp:Transcript_6023/g.20532  ORF Transcript_6023/g.20532 Transcript_6023/m.20532 type:complete len:227 (+) Transcript_6023:831-1511(+)